MAIYKKYEAESIDMDSKAFAMPNINDPNSSGIIGYHLFLVKLFLADDIEQIKNFYQGLGPNDDHQNSGDNKSS